LWNLDGFSIALEKGLIAMALLDITEPDTIITKYIQPNSIAMGIPAKFIMYR
jgi:hypothetical protein